MKFLLRLLLVCFFAGCAGQPKLPPRLRAIRGSAKFQPPAPTNEVTGLPLRLRWEYPAEQLDSVFFEFYSASAPDGPWSLFCRVTNALEYPFASASQGFFWGVAIDPATGLSSVPNR